MDEQGLAATMGGAQQGAPVGPAMAPPMAQQQASQAPTDPTAEVQKVAEMLAQGMTPEDLVAQGVPVEIVQMALDMLTQQAPAVAEEQSGLAGMYNKGGM